MDDEPFNCTARKRDGSFCDSKSVPFAPFPICPKHLTEALLFARGWVNQPNPRAAARRTKREELIAKAKADQSVVYYVREPTGAVKIGYSTNLKARLEQMRLPTDSVMATEPGGPDLEKMRHQQFKHLRIGRWERFTEADDLASHIAMIRDHYGPPTITTHPRIGDVADG